MNDTVTKLMSLADKYSIAYGWSGDNGVRTIDARQALQDELVRLCAPLTDEQIRLSIPEGDGWKFEVGFDDAVAFAKTIEAIHGITGEKL